MTSLDALAILSDKDKLLELMRAKSQRQIAKELKVDRKTIRKWEHYHGIQRPYINTKK